MRIWLPMLLCLLSLVIPVSAVEFTAPTVPDAGVSMMPEQTDSLPEALLEMLQKAAGAFHPDLKEAALISREVLCAVILVSLISSVSTEIKTAVNLAGTAAVASILFAGTRSMIHLAAETVQTLSNYGKMLLPVMTGALAAQGGVSAATGLYIGTAFFDSLLGSLLASGLAPFLHLYLGLAVASAASGEDTLSKLRDMIRNGISWCLKILLTVFTTYMSITGVVSGTVDAATLKATKVTISTVVPVVGGILSDASEAILVSAGVMKNAAGLYGIFAVLAMCLGPFLRIAAHYLILKATALIAGIFGSKSMAGVIGDFSSAMGILLAITGAMCLLLLISTVCFMKGMG